MKVPNLGKPVRSKVARIIADKGRKQVRGYDETGKLVVAYPSTIGSSDTPSPSGIVQVQRIAINPNYTYNPKINFKQGSNDKVLTIPPVQTVRLVRFGSHCQSQPMVFTERLSLRGLVRPPAMAVCA